jgi:hypothetical protein
MVGLPGRSVPWMMAETMGKTMGKRWENHGKTMGKRWKNIAMEKTVMVFLNDPSRLRW